jgi:glycosyltransferase involved in cell wall biosynthesis
MRDVTIIIPAYNEARFIEKAIRSAVSQAEFVIVSDNCSTDGTQQICKRLAKEFSNLVFYEQSKNLGSVKNAEFLYKQVQTDYVMNMGAHDVLAENYVYELKKCLDENPDAVMAYAPVISVDDDNQVLCETLLDDFATGFSSENVLERIYTAIKMEYNYAFYGLFRTDIFIKNADFIKEAGVDHLIMAKCAKDGKFIRCLNTRFYLRVPAREESTEMYMNRLAGEICEMDMSYACVHQLNILDSIDYSNQKEKDYIYNKARLSLHARYGKYCVNYAISMLKKLTKTNYKYILYGAGTNSQMIMPIVSDKILFIVDQDINMQEQKLDNIDIYPVEIINDYPDIPIIISQLGRFHIISLEIIKNYGVSVSRLISLDVDKAIEYE